MNASTDYEIKVIGGKIEFPKDLPDGVYKRVTDEKKQVYNNITDPSIRTFVKIPVSELSTNDSWFKDFTPKTLDHSTFHSNFLTALNSGVKDFYCSVFNPSFCDEKEDSICYLPGKRPAIGKTEEWRESIAKKFKPEYKSRLGTSHEFTLFLGYLIKKMVENGKDLTEAWNTICLYHENFDFNDDYYNSGKALPDTGSEEICGFYDLHSSGKILSSNQPFFSWGIAGVTCFHPSYSSIYNFKPIPIYNFCNAGGGLNHWVHLNVCTGWIVLEYDPY